MSSPHSLITLALDVGNTRLKWGVAVDRSWRSFGAIPVNEIALLPETHWKNLPKLHHVIGANVAGAVPKAQLDAIFLRQAVTPRWLTATQSLCGIKNHCVPPQSLGADRFAALIALRQKQLQMKRQNRLPPILHVTLGTAIVFDAISPTGELVGGIILPGFCAIRQGLAASTSALSLDIPVGNYSEFPLQTNNAIFTGVADAVLGAMDRWRKKLATRYGVDESEVVVFVDGGDVDKIKPLLSAALVLENNPVLEGLLFALNSGEWY
ncbi:MAG: type III pantothenate kinase [Burkholderiales bacterium]|jgi:type III pantothenate kinase|nr:type III pantothenate kinase [Burkholderiales bacterium]